MSLAQQILDARTACPFTESDLLAPVLHPIDAGADWINKGSYLTYWAVGHVLKPQSLIEIGSRYGYSLQSLCVGSGRVRKIYSFDTEHDFPGTCQYIREKFVIYKPVVFQTDTQALSDLPIQAKVDLAHVDANHAADGCYHDCLLAWRNLRTGGFLLVDDIASGADTVKVGADRFCEEKCLTPVLIECYRGMYLVQKP